jgi:prepilin-type N-terminal cleavage/methylation domain-containing protein
VYSTKGKLGFTLIELLVVIAIIAILAAILFPVFAQAKLAAKKIVDLSNIKEIGTATAIYVNDYDDTWPLATYYNTGAIAGGTMPYGSFYRWSSQLCLGPYLKSTAIFLSPVDSYTPDVTTHPTEAPYPSTRQVAPISFIANSFSNYYLLDSNGQCNYFPSTPTAVTNCQGPIDPGGWYDENSGSPNYTVSANPVSDTAATNPSDLIMYANGSVQLAAWNGCPNTVNTETFYCQDSDLVYGYDAVNMALGTSNGTPDPNMATAWRKYANQSNYLFSDTHAKTMAPGSLMIGLNLNPKYWLVTVPEGY